MNIEELSGMSYILQTFELDRGVPNNLLRLILILWKKKKSKNQKHKRKHNLSKLNFKKAVVFIAAVPISLHSGQNVATKATKHLA